MVFEGTFYNCISDVTGGEPGGMYPVTDATSDFAEAWSITPTALLDSPQNNHGWCKGCDETHDAVVMSDSV